MLPFDDEQNRALANLHSYYEQWIVAERENLDFQGSMRWHRVAGKEYLYHRVSSNPLVDTSLGVRSKQTEARFNAFKMGKPDALLRRNRGQAQVVRFAAMCKTLGVPLVPSKAAQILRQFDRKGLLGGCLMVVGTVAMAAYEIEAAARIFVGYDSTQDFDMTWRGIAGLQLHSKTPVSILATLQEVDPLYTRNTERSFQAVSGDYEVEVLAAPSTIASFPKGDLVPLAGMSEQEALLMGTPVRHVAVAYDRSAAPIVAPDPRWMALHKLWLSQKPQRNAVKKPKDQAQGLLLLRAVIEAMPNYPIDGEFVDSLSPELKPFLRAGVEWAKANRSGEGGGQQAVPRSNIEPNVFRKIGRFASVNLLFPTEYQANQPSRRKQ